MPPKRTSARLRKLAPDAVPEVPVEVVEQVPNEDVEMVEEPTSSNANAEPSTSASNAEPSTSASNANAEPSASAKLHSKFAEMASETVRNLLAGPPKPSGQASSNSAVIANEVLIQRNEAEGEEEAMDEDDWASADEVEDSYVVVDLHGFIDSKIINERVTENLCRVRHPESPNPVIQIGGQLFSGKYKEADGSIIIIEQHNEIGNKTFTLTGLTDTVMEARKTYLYAKGEEHESVPGETLRKPITMKLEQLSNKALPTYFKKKA